MKSQLFLPKWTRELLKSQISSYVGIFSERLFPVFADMERDADERADKLYNHFMNEPSWDENVDPASVAEDARDASVEYYSYLKLGKYHLTATWHAMLYQIWEQQVRLFLFREISHVEKIEFEQFCATKPIKEIKDKFRNHKVYIERFTCWGKIDELRLLCNVIKHSDGRALKTLRKRSPDLLKKGTAPVDLMELYKTSLLEETLNIDETTLEGYKEALLTFWEEVPERSFSDEL